MTDIFREYLKVLGLNFYKNYIFIFEYRKYQYYRITFSLKCLR